MSEGKWWAREGFEMLALVVMVEIGVVWLSKILGPILIHVNQSMELNYIFKCKLIL
jgi:hypothetical protein